jgi:hypothetical protein
MFDNLPATFTTARAAKRAVWAGALAALMTLCPCAARALQTLSLAWNPSSATGVAGYNVYCSTNGVNYETPVNVGTNTAYVASNLPEGQTVYFYVTAYNSQGVESPPSNELVYVVPGVVQLAPKTGARSAAYISFPVAPGHTYSLQASVNLQTWSTIWQSAATTNGWIQVRDVEGAYLAMRFYRLVWQ